MSWSFWLLSISSSVQEAHSNSVILVVKIWQRWSTAVELTPCEGGCWFVPIRCLAFSLSISHWCVSLIMSLWNKNYFHFANSSWSWAEFAQNVVELKVSQSTQRLSFYFSRMSHLDFLIGMDWKEESSKVVRRLVQTQSHLPQAWVFAARFELERKVTLH